MQYWALKISCIHLWISADFALTTRQALAVGFTRFGHCANSESVSLTGCKKCRLHGEKAMSTEKSAAFVVDCPLFTTAVFAGNPRQPEKALDSFGKTCLFITHFWNLRLLLFSLLVFRIPTLFSCTQTIRANFLFQNFTFS